jgi:hypothetical protein
VTPITRLQISLLFISNPDLVAGDPNSGHEVARVSVASDASFDSSEGGDCWRAFGSVGVYDARAKPTKDLATPLYIIDTQIVPPIIQTTLNEYRIVVVQPPPTSTQLPPPPEELPGRCYNVDADSYGGCAGIG